MFFSFKPRLMAFFDIVFQIAIARFNFACGFLRFASSFQALVADDFAGDFFELARAWNSISSAHSCKIISNPVLGLYAIPHKNQWLEVNLARNQRPVN
jgi:hypothetical protein